LSIDNFGSGKVGKNNGDAAGKMPNRPPIRFLTLAFTIGPFKKATGAGWRYENL
jgi:hypothetical protein